MDLPSDELLGDTLADNTGKQSGFTWAYAQEALLKLK
jgi:hypothetical protein